jgi:hypothetical protein
MGTALPGFIGSDVFGVGSVFPTHRVGTWAGPRRQRPGMRCRLPQLAMRNGAPMDACRSLFRRR